VILKKIMLEDNLISLKFITKEDETLFLTKGQHENSAAFSAGKRIFLSIAFFIFV